MVEGGAGRGAVAGATRRPPPGRDGVDELDDRRLVEQARRDPDAVAALYRRYLPRVHAYLYRRTGSPEVAEDLTAATFEAVIRGLADFRWQRGGFVAWMFRIASNELASHHRREFRLRSERARRAQQVLGPASGPDPFDLLAERLSAPVDLHGLLDRLNPRYQQAISLRFLADLSNTEAAAAMGCSKAAMAVTLHRALGSLRRLLNEGVQ